MTKPLIAEQKYPSLSSLSGDSLSVRIISSAYATPSGELNAVLQYQLHSVNFEFNGDKTRAELLKSIAIAEMIHLDLLAEAMIRMGAQPLYSSFPPAQFNFYSTKFVASSCTPKNMIEDDIVAEKYTIYCYERMLPRLKNDTLKLLICRILEDERLHVEAMTDSLEGLPD